MNDSAEPAADAGSTLLARAWALKDRCYEAWASDPSACAQAATSLQALHDPGLSAGQAVEIGALVAWTAGVNLVASGQMAPALRCFDEAADAFRGLGQADAAAQTQVPKIMALSMLGRHAEAAACGDAAQRELRCLGNLRAAARVSQNLGGMQLRRDAYADAARHYREAAVLFARLGERSQSLLADIGLADTLAAQGDFDEALRIYARARMRATQQGVEPCLALVDESVALVELARGQYAAALAGLESARRRYEALAMPHQLAIAEKQLGDAYLELRLLPEALSLFDAAVDRFGTLDMPDEQAWALVQRGRAMAWLQQAAAGDAFGTAGALFSAQGNQVGLAAVAVARAELALGAGDATTALAFAEQASTAFHATARADGRARAEVVRAQALLQAGRVAEAGAVFDTTLLRAQELQQAQVQLRCLTGCGLVAQARGETAAAQRLFEASIERFEDQRRALPGDEMRSVFLTDHLRPYEERLRQSLDTGSAAQTLLQLDRFRARALDDRLAEGPAPPADSATLALRERLHWLVRRVQRLDDEDSSSAALSDELLRTERQLLEGARRRRLLGPAGPSSATAAGLDVAALQAALAPGDALVEYGVLGDELFACVVTQAGVTRARHLASWSTVQQTLRSARFQIDALSHGASPLRQHLPSLTARAMARLAQLHALVWAPLADALGPCRRVLLVPHGPLAALPFAALPGPRGALGQCFEWAQVSSARAALRGLARPALPARRALVLGESSRLPHAAREAALVASLFAGGQALVGDRATLQTLRRHAADADVVHLACHAQFRTDNPRFSALHLHDGLLTVDAVETLGLRACTVVLSACESGLAQTGLGDDSVGLVRAFLVAGAARVVASLWPVDDEITAAFMTRFYRALAAGSSAASALGQAQREIQQAHPHPHHWGAFTLHGSW